MQRIRVIIAGSREFTDYPLMRDILDATLRRLSGKPMRVRVVSGCARGVDCLGERWAKERGHPVKKFPADWNRLGKSAGFKRNQEMAEYAHMLVAFWQDQSSGTRDMIHRMLNEGKAVHVYQIITQGSQRVVRETQA